MTKDQEEPGARLSFVRPQNGGSYVWLLFFYDHADLEAHARSSGGLLSYMFDDYRITLLSVNIDTR